MLDPDDYPTADDRYDAWDNPDDEYDTERAYYYDDDRPTNYIARYYTADDGTTNVSTPEFDCS